VPEPMPASPRLIAGLSSSASAGPIGCTSGRDALEFGVLDFGALDFGTLDFGVLPDFFGLSGGFAISGIWGESGCHERAIRRRPAPENADADTTLSADVSGLPRRHRVSPPGSPMTEHGADSQTVIASASEAIHRPGKDWIASSLTLPCANASRLSQAMTAVMPRDELADHSSSYAGLPAYPSLWKRWIAGSSPAMTTEKP
jgi:hypothetical protein